MCLTAHPHAHQVRARVGPFECITSHRFSDFLRLQRRLQLAFPKRKFAPSALKLREQRLQLQPHRSRAKRVLARSSALAATRRTSSPPACSGRPSRPERSSRGARGAPIAHPGTGTPRAACACCSATVRTCARKPTSRAVPSWSHSSGPLRSAATARWLPRMAREQPCSAGSDCRVSPWASIRGARARSLTPSPRAAGTLGVLIMYSNSTVILAHSADFLPMKLFSMSLNVN